jgi:hypothetical protein
MNEQLFNERLYHAVCDQPGHILIRMPGMEYGVDSKAQAVLLAESILQEAEKAWPDKVWQENTGDHKNPNNKGMVALINYNDESGPDLYSVELETDVGNWLDSFMTEAEAVKYINNEGMTYNHLTDFRDTRYKP